jgi:protein-S-isoprenylcysteine O-methyltransferase Ste14
LLQLYYGVLLATVAVADPLCGHGLAGRIAELAGLVLVAAATLARLWTTLFIAGHKEERVVTEGPYAWCRHPLYAFSIVASAGIGLTTRSWVLGLVTVVVVAILHFFAASREERMLEATLGASYRLYAQRLARFWPRATSGETPAQIEVKTGIYWKAYLDAGSIFALYVAIELIGLARDAGVWPSLAKLY